MGGGGRGSVCMSAQKAQIFIVAINSVQYSHVEKDARQ